MTYTVEIQLANGEFRYLDESDSETGALKVVKDRVAYYRIVREDGSIYQERPRCQTT